MGGVESSHLESYYKSKGGLVTITSTELINNKRSSLQEKKEATMTLSSSSSNDDTNNKNNENSSINNNNNQYQIYFAGSNKFNQIESCHTLNASMRGVPSLLTQQQIQKFVGANVYQIVCGCYRYVCIVVVVIQRIVNIEDIVFVYI
jgi:hypothetical protein